jgi:hypothetical protein
MKFILDGLEKVQSNRRVLVIIDAALFVNIRNFQVKTPLACPDFPNTFEKFF